MITFKHSGSFSKTEAFLNKLSALKYTKGLAKYGRMGVEALRDATPVDTGLTADGWDYEIEEGSGYCTIRFVNHHMAPTDPHVNIALLLQYGHGTRNGGYVVGRDYINPAIQPIFDKMAEEAWSEVIG